jgi:hypothetical protein
MITAWRRRGARALLLSCCVVLPCFWLPIVSGADLQSHLYNAWLADQIRQGRLSGLSIGHQWTNVLVDVLLAWLQPRWGTGAAERLVASETVLTFFWGALRFVSRVQNRPAYWLAPWLAVLSYGYVFQVGLLNFYWSLGITLWALSVAWGFELRRLLWVAPLLIVAAMAHPLPVLWFVVAWMHCRIAQRMQPWQQGALFATEMIALLVVRKVVESRYEYHWASSQVLLVTGADQALIYGRAYVVVAAAFVLLQVLLLFDTPNRRQMLGRMATQLFALTAATIVLLPTAIRSSTEDAWASLIAERLSLISGTVLLAALAANRARRLYLAAGCAVAVLFFALLHRDIANEAQVLSRMEAVVGAGARGDRVVAQLSSPPWSTIFDRHISMTHLISRACIGRCFDYMNYEPATNQFRIHARPGNTAVVARIIDAYAMEEGSYVVKPDDPPLRAVYFCARSTDQICLKDLVAGRRIRDQVRE